jgi:alpha-galactosidase
VPSTKIAIVGAGSAGVALDTLCDLVAHAETLHGSTIALVDNDAERLDQAARLAQRLSDAAGAGFHVEADTDRRRVLPDAGYVVTAAEANRLSQWRQDWEQPRRYGVRHVLGENDGPGGLAHALRTIPLALAICRDVEDLAPEALVIEFTNPLPRLCLALSRYTGLRVVGLCHQIAAGYADVSQVLDLPVDEVQLTAAGINHFTWALAITHRPTGADLYPAFRERLARQPLHFEPLSRRLLDAFGLYPCGGDDHFGEDLGFAWETDELAAHPEWPDLPAVMVSQQALRRETSAVVEEALVDDEVLRDLLEHRSGERIVPVICATLGDEAVVEDAANLVNQGAIANLPDWAVVEAPTIVGPAAISPVPVGPLPDGCAALLAQRIAIHSLTVEAAVHRDRQAALQALLLDPIVNSYDVATRLLDDILARVW